jgi:hypothetical protein
MMISLTKYYYDNETKEHEKATAAGMVRIAIAHEVEETFVCLFVCLLLSFFVCLFVSHLKSLSVTQSTEERTT